MPVVLVCSMLAVAARRLVANSHSERIRRCDANYVALNREVADELDSLVARGRSERCGATSREAIIDCVVARHRDARNRHDRSQPAYTSGPAERCQVRLVPSRSYEITFEQPTESGLCRFEILE